MTATSNDIPKPNPTNLAQLKPRTAKALCNPHSSLMISVLVDPLGCRNGVRCKNPSHSRIFPAVASSQETKSHGFKRQFWARQRPNFALCPHITNVVSKVWNCTNKQRGQGLNGLAYTTIPGHPGTVATFGWIALCSVLFADFKLHATKSTKVANGKSQIPKARQ